MTRPDLDDVGNPKHSTDNLRKDRGFSNEIWIMIFEEVDIFICLGSQMSAKDRVVLSTLADFHFSP